MRGHVKDHKKTQLIINFCLLCLTYGIIVDLTYIDNGLELNFISAFGLKKFGSI